MLVLKSLLVKKLFKMNRQLLTIVISFFLLTIMFIFGLYYFYRKAHNRNLENHFYGVVDSVNYDVKGIPTVIVNENKYYLSAGYNFNHQIERGDKLKKDSGSTAYILTKHKTNEIFNFNN